MPTHYEVLGVGADAETETIRRAYLTVAKANHPDRRQAEDPARRDRAEEQMRAANAAWNVLRDPGRRADYDRSLRGPTTATGPDRSGPTGGAAGRSAGPPRPQPPSGIVVPAPHASLWRYAPVVVVLVVLGLIFVVTAYATAGGDATGPSPAPSGPPTPEVGDCILVVGGSGGLQPVIVGCGTQGSYRVQTTTSTPRPCPSGSSSLPLSDDETTLCLVAAG